MPTDDYVCEKCKSVQLELWSIHEGSPESVPCQRCGHDTKRTYGAPAIGSVPGAGGSPARPRKPRGPL